ncbi:MAG: nuclear transport factor 2 family protein [Ferruginibacter sp.]|nr:nuclear transport factor 2 family protein [Chitinophagaceae bacterium]MBP6287046.1 nuclear transport factor 2 family protein [Ferruginibacter sp.]MBU9936926.1 nuclear transport factor 2 family protein [Ferruginibacter sp.]
MKRYFLSGLFSMTAAIVFGQIDRSTDLYKILRQKDSLLFNAGFNTCDTAELERLVSDDFEFYHDQSGITPTKADFITSIRNGLCKLNYKARRELVEESVEVFPLNRDGVLYGAIQTGRHNFYAIEKDKPEYLSTTAVFTHLWLLENGNWKLKRVLSYNHQEPKRLN